MNTDFIGFSFGKTHLLRDLNVYRTSDGSRYNKNLTPSLTDKAVDISGSDGQLFFGSHHKNRQFNVNFAFDNLTDENLRKLQKLRFYRRNRMQRNRRLLNLCPQQVSRSLQFPRLLQKR